MTSDWARVPAGIDPAKPIPRSEITVETLYLADDGRCPNHPSLPAMILHSALSGGSIDGIKALYEANRWFRVWDYTVFDYHHFHPDAHEALTVARGEAVIRLGGESGRDVEVRPGDVMVLPAGTGHKRMRASDGFTVVGGYPKGQEARTIRVADKAASDAVRREVAGVGLPATDPVYGAEGPLFEAWR
ncbi:MAG: cupin domain-containing protein [Paracoccaceae bacterium]